MSTTVELVRANERYARLRAAVEGLAAELQHYDGAVMSNERFGEGFLAGLTYSSQHLRALLAAVDS